MKRILLTLGVITMVAAFAFIQGCSNDENPVEALDEARTGNDQQMVSNFTPCQDDEQIEQAEFDPELISSLPIDLASVEQTLLSGTEHEMIGQEGDEVRFIIYDESLPDGQGQFLFNTKTFSLSYEGEESLSSTETSKDDPGGGLITGCYYQFMGSTNCWGRTWYGYFCLRGSWYCYLFNSCRWIPIGSC